MQLFALEKFNNDHLLKRNKVKEVKLR